MKQTSLKLPELLPHLEEAINDKMDELTKAAKKSKKLREETDVLYAEMKKIVLELKYVLPIVKEQSPQMVPLLEELEK